MPRRFPLRMAVTLGGLAVITLLVVAVIARGQPVPDGPAPVAWNHQACAHCRMLVGEPAHAAQLVTRGGDVFFFDDPGCLLRYLRDRDVAVHRLWFHDHGHDRWLAADEVGFVTGATTPMGYGLAAVPRGTPGAIDLAAARAQLAAPAEHGHGAAP